MTTSRIAEDDIPNLIRSTHMSPAALESAPIYRRTRSPVILSCSLLIEEANFVTREYVASSSTRAYETKIETSDFELSAGTGRPSARIHRRGFCDHFAVIVDLLFVGGGLSGVRRPPVCPAFHGGCPFGPWLGGDQFRRRVAGGLQCGGWPRPVPRAIARAGAGSGGGRSGRVGRGC